MVLLIYRATVPSQIELTAPARVNRIITPIIKRLPEAAGIGQAPRIPSPIRGGQRNMTTDS
ncbi:hypothetical protein GCM10027256_06940 [Novispirillum itersonii subsp. nipponicum]